MRRYFRCLCFGFVVSVGGAGWCVAQSDVGGRAWTPEDSARVRYFQHDPSKPVPLPVTRNPNDTDKSPALLSPDGKHFLFVSYHGDPDQDQNIGELFVFSVDRVRVAIERGDHHPPEPLHRVTFRSSLGEYRDAPIMRPIWSDARYVEFVGRQGAEPRQIFQLDMVLGSVTQLTHGEEDVHSDIGGTLYSVQRDPSGGVAGLLYATMVRTLRKSPLDTPLNTYPAAVLGPRAASTQDPLEAHFLPWTSLFGDFRLYARYQGGAPVMVAENRVPLIRRLSPDGRHAIVLFRGGGTAMPADWANYEIPNNRVSQFHVIDLQSGKARPLMDAPVGSVTHVGTGLKSAADAFWSHDGRSVVLFNTALPVNKNAENRRGMAYLVEYRPETGQWEELMPLKSEQGRIEMIRWHEPGRSLRLQRVGESGSTGLLLSYDDGRWRLSSAVPTELPVVSATWPEDFKVYIQESNNTEPRIMAELQGRSLPLTGDDPALRGVNRHDWERMSIPFGDREIRALLMRAGQKQGPGPLAILIADLIIYDGSFQPDGGPWAGGFAAQSLAAQGISVLSLEAPAILYKEGGGGMDSSLFTTPREGPAVVQAVEAAIDEMVSRGIADPNKVGLAGFSRSGYYTYYVISHPHRHRISAAVIFDSITTGYGEYVNSMALGDEARVYERQYADTDDPLRGVGLQRAERSTPRFWENKQGWLDAPAFNLDRVRTPTLFSIAGLGNEWAMMETLGGWRYMGLPFEYHFYPRAGHPPVMPSERVFSMRAAVEWMSFWLQGELPLSEGRRGDWVAMKAAWEQEQSGREDGQ